MAWVERVHVHPHLCEGGQVGVAKMKRVHHHPCEGSQV